MAKSLPGPDDYFKTLNLHKDPFLKTYHPDSYFCTPEIQHRLDLIRHLLEFSQQILLVKGDAKVGKSAFCQHLIANADDDWIVCAVEASGSSGPDALVREMLQDHLAMLENETETIAIINNFLEYCQIEDKTPVVFIDNADLLDQPTLRFVFQLNEFRAKETYIRVVLIGLNSLLDRLNDIGEQKSNAELIHSINIPVFTLQQTTAYLQHRLADSGGRTDLFSEKEINRIHKVSAGIPGDINFLARQGLSDPANLADTGSGKIQDLETTNRRKQFAGLVLAAGIITLLMIVFVLPGQNSTQPQITTHPVNLPPETLSALNDTMDSVPIIIEETPPDSWMESMAVTATDIPGINQYPVLEKTSEQPGIVDTQQQENLSSGGGSGERKDVDVERENNRSTGLKSGDWLLAQAGDAYALQLIGAQEMTTITRFLENSRLDREKLALYTVKKSDKDWHVLLYGVFTDIVQARAAIPDLSLPAQSQTPWPKAMRTVHEELGKP